MGEVSGKMLDRRPLNEGARSDDIKDGMVNLLLNVGILTLEVHHVEGRILYHVRVVWCEDSRPWAPVVKAKRARKTDHPVADYAYKKDIKCN
jgi:hypothetical protein